jgi:hypothetical protein
MNESVIDVSDIEELRVRADNSVSFDKHKSLLVLGDEDKSDDSFEEQLENPMERGDEFVEILQQ